ncbi:MAG: sodium/proline symporter PutP [Firmicutes bacterium HGW-Firmicutes-2]|jgi:sodium/proline symporter|nr:MAG: sodium/proline symporter PutP [Firmicutes bacterium HGW-Firmicutes-2]
MDISQVTKLMVLAFYLLCMIGIGFIAYRKTSNFSDYVLGGRNLGSWTTALSAQASDMSGWLLLGLPGAAYLGGIQAAWIGIGLALGTYINWKMVAKRLRQYTELSKNSLTLSDFFENRFRDDTKILRVVSALVIIVFFSVYTSAQFAAGAKLFELVMGIPYTYALILGGFVIVLYTFLGGFMAVSSTDVIQGILMFIALMVVPVIAVAELGGFGEIFTALESVDVNYMNLFKDTGTVTNISFIVIISNLAWGLGYFGQPHILARFMAARSSDHIKKARLIAMIWVILTLFAAVFVGMVGRLYFVNAPVADAEKVFMHMVDGMFIPILSGLFLSAILAASMSTADSQLLVTASSISEDFYKQFFKKNADDKELILVGRLSVAIVSVIAILIALNPNSSVFGLVSNAWAGFGAAFGPVILLSLFWKRMNKWGAMAGMISGTLTVIFWITVAKNFDGAIWQIYEIVPAFIVALVAIVLVSQLTAPPTQEITDEFDAVVLMEI